MFDNSEKSRKIARWIIAIVTACALIYLGIRHISAVVTVIGRVLNIIKPLLIGFVFALMLNVPTTIIENKFLAKWNPRRGKRSLSILLSVLVVTGVIVGIFALVVPELIGAVKLIIEIISDGIEQLIGLKTQFALSDNPLIQYLDKINIDWTGIQNTLTAWFEGISNNAVNYTVEVIGSILNTVVTVVIGLTFAIYMIAKKETLKRQASRLICVWLPEKMSSRLIHISYVCSTTFKQFIAGQVTEAVILGTLCTIGMAIMRIPYAPMIGALIGVTSLIPIAGGLIGGAVGTIMILTLSPLKAFIFLVFLLVLQQIEGNVIYPRVVGGKINLPAIWVLAAVVVGGNIAGPLGMLLGVPATSAAYSLVREATNNREIQKKPKEKQE